MNKNKKKDEKKNIKIRKTKKVNTIPSGRKLYFGCGSGDPSLIDWFPYYRLFFFNNFIFFFLLFFI